MPLRVLTLLLVTVFGRSASSLYFNVGDTERKCFTEDIPDDTVLVGVFRAELGGDRRDEDPLANQDLQMLVEAKDPEDKLVLSRRYGSEGTFHFTSLKPGRHQICLQPSSPQRPLSAGGTLMVHLDVRTGEATNNYALIAAEDKLTELQLKIRRLKEQVLQIQKEQSYQRFRHKRFREVNLSINTWIFWWPVVRSLYIVAFVMWNTNTW